MSEYIDAEFKKLQKHHRSAALLKEGGVPMVFLPSITVKVNGIEFTMDLMLHPSAHSGYMTRLFFQRKIDGYGKNWTQQYVGDEQWWTPSYNNVPETMSWWEMLWAHLGGLKHESDC